MFTLYITKQVLRVADESAPGGYRWSVPLKTVEADGWGEDGAWWVTGIPLGGKADMLAGRTRFIGPGGQAVESPLAMREEPRPSHDKAPPAFWRLSDRPPVKFPAIASTNLDLDVAYLGPVDVAWRGTMTRMAMRGYPRMDWPVRADDWIGVLTTTGRGLLRDPSATLLALSDRGKIDPSGAKIRLAGSMDRGEELFATMR